MDLCKIIAWLGCRGDFLELPKLPTAEKNHRPGAVADSRRWFFTPISAGLLTKLGYILICTVGNKLPPRHPNNKLVDKKFLPNTEPAWSLLRLSQQENRKILGWIVVKEPLFGGEKWWLFLPGDTSQQKPILFSTATELELGPGIAESPICKLIPMEFKVRS